MNDEIKLPPMQKQFVHYYIEGGLTNGKLAAERAGYKSPAVRSSELLKSPKVRAYIDAYWADRGMETNEAVARLTEQARAAYSEYINGDGSVDLDRMKKESWPFDG